jgi:hypothetical protein
MLITLARALRAGRVKHRSQSVASHGHGIDWVDVAVAGVLTVEALERWIWLTWRTRTRSAVCWIPREAG